MRSHQQPTFEIVKTNGKDALQLADLRPVLKVLESYTNLGPIVDFVVMDLERQGQGQVC